MSFSSIGYQTLSLCRRLLLVQEKNNRVRGCMLDTLFRALLRAQLSLSSGIFPATWVSMPIGALVGLNPNTPTAP